jgi:hypothetical protein
VRYADVEVQEVRRAVLTAVMFHRRERRRWLAIADDDAETAGLRVKAASRAKGEDGAIHSLLSVLDDVRTAARARDNAFSGYLEVFGATG